MSPHSHQHHTHGTEEVSDRVLLWTVVANFALSLFEVVAGVIAGSVALMADALHNTNDAAALLIAYIARRISRRAADHQFTFGYRRAELVGALIQLTALIIIALYLVYEGVKRFISPEPPSGSWMMAAAGVALVVDLGTAWLLWAMSKGSLNVKAAFLHNLTDAGASIAVLAGGAAVYWLGWGWVDPVLSLVIAGYILRMSFSMLAKTAGILMDGTPEGISLTQIEEAVVAFEGVKSIHHLHVWGLDEHRSALEAHIVLSHELPATEVEKLRADLKSTLAEHFEIGHSTLEFETPGCECRDAGKGLVLRH